jgi:hypothetical protein
VEDGEVNGVRRLIVDRARWAVVTVNLDGISDETTALRKIEDQIRPVAKQAEGRLLAIRVNLEHTAELARVFRADPQRLSDEVQAAAHRCAEDVWLENLRLDILETSTPVASSEAITSLDLNATLTALQSDPALRGSAAALIEEITAKLPRGIHWGDTPLSKDLDALLNDARALVLGRAEPER